MYHVENGRLLYGGEPMSLERVQGVATFLNTRDIAKALNLAGIQKWRVATRGQIEMLQLLKSSSYGRLIETHILYIELTELLVNNLEKSL